jgi:hypothetical protein
MGLIDCININMNDNLIKKIFNYVYQVFFQIKLIGKDIRGHKLEKRLKRAVDHTLNIT